MAKAFPEELLLQFLSQPSISPRIESDEHGELFPEQYTLYNASLVSKTFNRLTEPLLYESINARSKERRVLRLVQTLARRPELAQHVRELRLGYLCNDMDNPSRIETEWNAFTQNAAKIVQRAHVSREFVKLFQTALDTPSYSSDLGLALFMVMCSNLRAWEFVTGDTLPLTERVFFDAGAASIGTNAPTDFQPLQNLRELTISYWDTEYSAGFLDVRRYIDVPSLQTLRCTQFRLDDDWDGLRCGAERVKLESADIEGDRVHGLFSVFPRVSDLMLRWGSATVCDAEINFAEIGARLRASGCNLKRLYLNAEESFWIEDATHLPPLGSLRSLERLTELSLQAVMLTGRGESPHDLEPIQGEPLNAVLPFSLHVLEINSFNPWGPTGYNKYDLSYTDLEGWFDEQITELLSDQRYDKLHTIRMIGRKYSADALLANASQLGWVTRLGNDAGRSEATTSIDWETPQERIELGRLSPS